jgi:hypothetical protein
LTLFEKYKANFLAHIEATPLFELAKEGFALLGIYFSIILLLKFIFALKRWARPNPPKQFFQ